MCLTNGASLFLFSYGAYCYYGFIIASETVLLMWQWFYVYNKISAQANVCSRFCSLIYLCSYLNSDF